MQTKSKRVLSVMAAAMAGTANAMIMDAARILLGYLLGSISGSLLLGLALLSAREAREYLNNEALWRATLLFGSARLPKVMARAGHACWHAVWIVPSGIGSGASATFASMRA